MVAGKGLQLTKDGNSQTSTKGSDYCKLINLKFAKVIIEMPCAI